MHPCLNQILQVQAGLLWSCISTIGLGRQKLLQRALRSTERQMSSLQEFFSVSLIEHSSLRNLLRPSPTQSPKKCYSPYKRWHFFNG